MFLRWKRERGAAMVECAIIFSIVLLLVFGIIQLAMIAYATSIMQDAAQAAARAAAVELSDTKATAAAAFVLMPLRRIAYWPSGTAVASHTLDYIKSILFSDDEASMESFISGLLPMTVEIEESHVGVPLDYHSHNQAYAPDEIKIPTQWAHTRGGEHLKYHTIGVGHLPDEPASDEDAGVTFTIDGGPYDGREYTSKEEVLEDIESGEVDSTILFAKCRIKTSTPTGTEYQKYYDCDWYEEVTGHLLWWENHPQHWFKVRGVDGDHHEGTPNPKTGEVGEPWNYTPEEMEARGLDSGRVKQSPDWDREDVIDIEKVNMNKTVGPMVVDATVTLKIRVMFPEIFGTSGKDYLELTSTCRMMKEDESW